MESDLLTKPSKDLRNVNERERKEALGKSHVKLVKRQELKLLRHYDYGEYQFSASSTPLIHRYHRKEFKNRGHRGLCSFLYLCWCLGNLKVEGSGECQLAEGLPNGNFQIEDGFIGAEDEGEEESVDEKAERFIESFYQQIRMQRQKSL
ncbi:hypothetical protein JHK82_029374 [Glycine max]|nr:hypothetical protein JHK86_029489 [Glycine max]KAG5128539.1 hypothetical protein JHK82_029374 [Glycine max]